jgi:CheY-like chemotaxis protein
VKFTPDLGRVDFSVKQSGEADGKILLDFSVRDTGIGITPEAMENLFQPFEQGNAGVARRYGGTGLGLAISRSIVRLLGGDITVDSAPGEGSAFGFSLWMKEAAPADEEAETEIDGKDRFAGKRALIVDDVAVNRVIVTDLLEYTGLSLDEAEDGADAVEMFRNSKENEYDIIYMDVQMPKMDGYEAAKIIRGMDRPDAKTVPIVALTANAFKEDIDRAIKSGMNAHLAKPLDAVKLIEATYKLIGEGRVS